MKIIKQGYLYHEKAIPLKGAELLNSNITGNGIPFAKVLIDGQEQKVRFVDKATAEATIESWFSDTPGRYYDHQGVEITEERIQEEASERERLLGALSPVIGESANDMDIYMLREIHQELKPLKAS